MLSAQSALNRLEDKTQFDLFSGPPLYQKYGQVSGVKIVFDIKKERLHFMNANRYTLHYEFCKNYLNYTGELSYFNSHNYGDKGNQKYLLANLNYFKTLDTYVLEISAVDTMSANNLLRLYQLIAEHSFIGSELKILLNTTRLQTLAPILKEKAPLIYPSDIYKNLTYQPIGKHKGYGTLKFVTDLTSSLNDIEPTDIVVLKETPLFLPEVAGILVAKFQTPLSHLTILGQNRKIPIAAYTSAFKDSSLYALEHKRVRYEVANDTFYIAVSNKKERKKRKHRTIKVASDLTIDSLIDIAKLGKKSFKYVGNKAANFGTLYRLAQKNNFKTPEAAFSIPFYFYKQHIEHSEAAILISNLLSNPAILSQKDSLKNSLKQIRTSIKRSPINSGLLKAVKQKIHAKGTHKRMRFRSSTNAEDAKGFSGAGLYTSKTGIVDHPKKTLEKAIKKVWASLWSYEAFLERTYYGIDHKQVFMGILVHRSFPEEDVNGVAITKNIYREGNQGFVVNAQLGNESVVQPKEGIISDQFICYPDEADDIYKNTADYIATSSLTEGKPIMKPHEIKQLANQLHIIKRHFYRRIATGKSFLDFGMDIEFKLDGPNRQLYIKQARLYND